MLALIDNNLFAIISVVVFSIAITNKHSKTESAALIALFATIITFWTVFINNAFNGLWVLLPAAVFVVYIYVPKYSNAMAFILCMMGAALGYYTAACVDLENAFYHIVGWPIVLFSIKGMLDMAHTMEKLNLSSSEN